MPTVKKKPKKNPSDPNLLARSVIEAANGEPLNKSKISHKTVYKEINSHK
jgi:hypothetical protein